MKALLNSFFLVIFLGTYFSDTSASSHGNDVFILYRNAYLVETGSWVGDGVEAALDKGFEEIHSIELSPYYYSMCTEKFKNFPNVHIWFGDSGAILKDVIGPINEPITFWLDGHWCGDEVADGSSYKGEEFTPLLRELEAIKNHPIKTHTIIIDDVRCFETYLFQGLSQEVVLQKLKEINPKYKITYEDGAMPNDILVAYIED